jgi:hypothetical protein
VIAKAKYEKHGHILADGCKERYFDIGVIMKGTKQTSSANMRNAEAREREQNYSAEAGLLGVIRP